mmetsp:Transcript_10704/g.22750  ORF Transcript_10704/g.22750 Transcript_10704/m.22750 type:complete len:252 (+) Transcript_10704:496-1251(+)
MGRRKFSLTAFTCRMCIPPVLGRSGTRVSYKAACDQAAIGISQLATSANTSGKCRLLTVDLPPTPEEQRSGTLVARYEHHYNVMQSIALALGSKDNTAVGGEVQICDNVNPQGGGEYLTDDETMSGIQAECGPLGRVVLLANAGVDMNTLKQVRDLDDGIGTLILLNCALERLTFFNKIGTKGYFDDFEVAYYLKVVAGCGFLMKVGLSPWKLFGITADGAQLVKEWEERPSQIDSESALRSYLAGIVQPE